MHAHIPTKQPLPFPLYTCKQPAHSLYTYQKNPPLSLLRARVLIIASPRPLSLCLSLSLRASAMEIAHKDYLLSSLLQLLNLLTLLVSLSVETFIFVRKCNPWCHLLPVSLTLLLRRALAAKKQTYLLDFSCLKPPRRYRVPIAGLLEHLSLINCFDADSVAFMTKVITSSGMGNETYFPPSLHDIPPSATHLDAMREVHMLLFPTLHDLFAKTGVSPLDVDALVVNCSGFCPSPSLSAIVVNRYGMRHDVRTFNLSGMGCSAGVVGVDVARALLSNINRRSYLHTRLHAN